MRIAVFGTGGVGGYFGGRLAQAGEDVIFIARGEHLKAIRQNGLRVDSIAGDFVTHPAQATDTPAEVGAVDAVLVTVKAWQVSEAAESMKPMVGPKTMVIPLENGVDASDQLAAVLGAENVLGGLCHLSALIADPGHIKHVAIPPRIAFGELDGRTSERVERLRQVFERCQGVTAAVPTDIRVALWEKFLFIAAISGVGAVTRQPAGVIRSVAETREKLLRAMEEVAAVAEARGIALSPGIVQKTMAFIDNMPSATMASMQRDIIEGRPSELDAQNGAVVRLGREAGIPTPTHEFIYASLLPGELKARGKSA
ncbi:MAG: 2-dehydropantoate 2-reductase [Anaerolineales bacterium]|nr:2-dehydropantoate 2-reductase [Anaerolineales bacterium]